MIDVAKTAAALAVAISIALPAAGQPARARPQPAETYQSADVDANGDLRIVTSDGRSIRVPRQNPPSADSDAKQTRFEKPVVSADRRAVGAQAMFTNCCTSYDIPLQLVVYSQGRTHRFDRALAIFDWHFVDGGRRIAFSMQPVHFACSVQWELREVESERLVGDIDIPVPCGTEPNARPVTVPPWVSGTASGGR
jgi:hypothetical protein